MLKTKEQVDPCTVELNVEVEPEQVTLAIDNAYRHLAKRVAIPGFRKGKAPRAILERYIEEDAVKDHAARELVPQAYEDALTEAEIEPYDLPEVEVVQIETEQPFLFRATVPLPPVVELGDYVGLKVERMASVVSDEDVDRQLQEMRERAARPEPVEGRPVQQGDYVGVEIQRLGVEGEEAEPFKNVVQAGQNLPSFDEKLVGMSVGDEQVIEISYEEDFQDATLAGTTAQLKTKVLEIKERRVPELDDDFAKAIGMESVDELLTTVRTRMEQTTSNIADRQVESQLLFQIVEKSSIHFPNMMKEQESSHRLQDLLKRLEEANLQLSDYLKEIDKTFEELKTEIGNNAERDIKVQLAIFEIAKRENITVQDEDLDAEIERLAQEKKVAKASMQAYIDRTEGMSTVASRLLRKKVLDFLVNASNIKNVAKKGVTE